MGLIALMKKSVFLWDRVILNLLLLSLIFFYKIDLGKEILYGKESDRDTS